MPKFEVFHFGGEAYDVNVHGDTSPYRIFVNTAAPIKYPQLPLTRSECEEVI